MRSHIFALSAAVGLAAAAPAQQDSLSTSTITQSQFTSSTTCATLGGETPLFPAPTNSVTSDHEIKSTAPAQVTYETTSYVTGTVTTGFTYTTLTTVTAPAVTVQLGPNNGEIFEVVTSTLTALTLTETVCANPGATTMTEYTGAYSPSITTRPAVYPTQVDCTLDMTTFLTYYPLVVYPVTTYTLTPQTTAGVSTSTRTYTPFVYLPPTEPGTTTTVTQTSFVVDGTRETATVASCAETVTKTLDARCHPTNLIGSSQNGEAGINTYTYGAGVASTFGFVEEAHDVPLCCQRCVDTEGCAASAAFPAAGNCELFFSNETVSGNAEGRCGLTLLYSKGDGYDFGVNAGSVIGVGCGTVEEIL